MTDVSANVSTEKLPALTSTDKPKRTRKEIAALASAAATEKRVAKARARKMNETKVQKALEQGIMRASKELLRAALIPALGCIYVYKIVKIQDGKRTIEKHVQITDPHEIGEALDAISNDASLLDEEYVYVVRDKPDFRAIEMLWTRGFGKPVERKQVDIKKQTYSLVELHKERDEMVRAGELPTVKEMT